MTEGKPLHTASFIDILPDSLQQDKTIQAAAAALDCELSVINEAIPPITLWPRIDSMIEPELSTLAGQFSLIDEPVWGQAEDDETKRELLQGALELHRHKGTPWAIREVMRVLGYGEIELLEGIGNLHYDGTGEHDGVYTYGQENAWAIYDIIMGPRLNAAQERALRATLSLIAPARCHLDQFLPLYKASLMLSVNDSGGLPVASGKIVHNWSPLKPVWVKLIAKSHKGATQMFEVMADTEGTFHAELPLPPATWMLQAQTTVFDPINQPIKLESQSVQFEVEAYPIAIIPEKTDIWLLPGEERTIHITVLPEEANDKTYTAISNSNAVTLSQNGSELTLKGRDFGNAEITLRTNVGNLTAVINARVVSGAKADVNYTSINAAVFFASRYPDEEEKQIWFDWGDGNQTTDHRVATQMNGFNPPLGVWKEGEKHTVTIYNSEDVTFKSASSFNRITKLYKVAGLRTELDYFLYQQDKLTTIADDAFAYLPNLQSIRYFLAHTNVTQLPSSLLTKETMLEDADYAFYYCKFKYLPAGFLQKATKLKSANSMLRNTSLNHIDNDTFKACADSLEDISDMLAFSSELRSDVNAVFSASRYSRLRAVKDGFYGCTNLTGRGTEFIEKCTVASRARLFAGCTSLSDYEDLPIGWK